ncbi:DUF397 domain-containing protein [Streptomyces sp. NRRL F-525]|uniref:DUF397 domain-containing protein n=1 Tax=Streptomyces sp. NRRL F-525 TaxID=1463861 RepID=UPI000525A418|nr:DUF397 domain-containing protein [Streptomyces sp. NRRL F-525]
MNTPTPPRVDVTGLHWIKARASSDNGACVELASAPNGWVALRDSKDPEGGILMFTREEMAAFVTGASAGDFDHLI